MDLNNMIISETENIIGAWKIINSNGCGTVFVVNDVNKLVGILSDGDIRRFLLKKENVNGIIKDAMNKDFTWAYFDEPENALLKKINHKVTIIPLVNYDFELVDYFRYKTDTHIPIAIPNLGGNEFKYLMDAFLSTWISSKGKYILEFEKAFSSYCGMGNGVAVSNGTVALHLALMALDIGPDDEVIVPDLTFAATINAVIYCGATPVIVDIEEESWCIDPVEIEKAITPRTRAIIPVHLYGQPCDMDKIMAISKKHNLHIIEDCAEAHGAEHRGKKVGSFGVIGCFSFFGNKIITTGEGGMCITNNSDIAGKMRKLRDHGMNTEKRYWHDCIGYNYRMTNLQAAIGLAQLERIEVVLSEREKLEYFYRKNMENISGITFQRNDLPDRKKITWMISMLYYGDKDALMNKMESNNIEVRPFFYPLSQMPIYKKYVFSGEISHKISLLGINFPTNYMANREFLNKLLDYLSEFSKQGASN